jgi:hypothetical protein
MWGTTFLLGLVIAAGYLGLSAVARGRPQVAPVES